MKIEHVAFQVENPPEVAEWYMANMGFTCKRSADAPVPVRFLADASGNVMLEIYNNPKVKTPDYTALDPLLLHVAFSCLEIPAAVDRLTAAGAILLSGPEILANGDEIAMLRDPWGLAIQLCKRSQPMI
ncbi:TPA: glyoxalase/bleomycin resistance/dioxygenase family protein [Candidatus Sumerlaeota bacterium]|nr:glyoxalase/bleomycin resistance/dioxygenase family protein [Candidatus Sumerlaeota bacterium]